MYPNTGCHAVLALLSEGHPPLEGRSPTRYSPVCHATNPLRDLRVRLACVRHAASVDSEPGSNSQVKFAVPPWRLAALRREQLINPIACFIGSRIHSAFALASARASADRSSNGWLSARKRSHPLILDGLCLHVLSSFQRTGNGPGQNRAGSLPPSGGSAVRWGTYQTYDNFVSRVNRLHRIGAKRRFLEETRCRWALPGCLVLSIARSGLAGNDEPD